jgi:hypothetical protein
LRQRGKKVAAAFPANGRAPESALTGGQRQISPRDLQVRWVQVYPPDQYSALFARLRRQGCADRSLVTMHVNTVSSGP